MAAAAGAVNRGIVKQVLSGDSVVIRGQPRNGPPPEKTLYLSNVMAPRLARRPNPNVEQQEPEQPYAWEAREWLRKKLINKEVSFSIEYKAPGSGREYGFLYLGKDESAENITECLVAEGLVEVRRAGVPEKQQVLIALEDAAKAAKKGKWGDKEEVDKHVRNVTWTHENLSHLVDSYHKQPVDAVIEHVRDGCTVRAFLLPQFHYVTVMLSGIKCPMFKNEDGKQVAEPFAEQAKFFTECRLLQRDVKITLESVSNQNCVGSVVHPCGNIAELIVREGFARLADWSMGVVSTGSEKLREAEKYAKAQKKRLWEGYEPSKAAAEIKDKNFQGKVIEILNGDGMMLKTADGNVRKIFLSSVRPPRAKPQDPNEEPIKKDPKTRPRPLYDVPYMYEAREFLRKKLVDKKVNVTIDYIQPKTDDYPEKTCCTVTVNGINVADALIGRGLATAVRYRQDDDQRSSAYYDLLAAEERAKKKEVGMFSKRESPVLRVSDTSGDLQKAKQFLPFLQRAGKTTGIVEFVASGSRLRIYIPKETCLITFLLSGIQCPRATRKDNATGAVINAGDPFGDAAMLFTKENVMQRDVEVTVESMDRAGNFIGWLTRDGMNMSVALVEEGLSKVHNTAEKSHFFGILQAAEAKAKARKANIWSLEQEVAQEAKPLEAEPQERKVNYKKVVVSYVAEDSPTFFAQKVQTGPELVALMEQMHTALANAAAPAVAYTPVKDRMCVAKYSRDNQWYRAVVQKVQGGNVDVFFIDYGNTDKLSVNQLAAIPNEFAGLPAQAEKYTLACVTMPDEEDDKQNAADNLYDLLMDGTVFLLNEEYTGPTGKHASLIHEESKDDIAEMLIRDGFFLAESRREKRLAKLVEDYAKAQAEAMANRKRIWQYGDFREDEAREFGYKK